MLDQPRAFVLLLILSAIPAFAQSFDCKRAITPREKTICADTRLQALDAELTAAYKSLRAQLSPASSDQVQSDQREWLQWIDRVCPAHVQNPDAPGSDQTRCLQSEYFTRVHDLKHTTQLGSATIFLRSHFVYKPVSVATKIPDDPGFGFGSLRWPQIDRPNHAQSQWNAAVKARAAKAAIDAADHAIGIDDPKKRDTIFDTAVDPSGTIEAYYTIQAANDRLIAVTFTDGTYGWGSAHPNTSPSSFLWWLDRNRELTADDVFLPHSDWLNQLTNLAVANLGTQPDLHDWIGKPNELFAPVHDTAENPSAWTLTRDGLTITFGQYAIGPYVIGMPEAHVSWTDIAPLLQPTLNPATLPAPTPKPNP